MAQHLADLRQGHPLAQHVDGKSMTKLVRPGEVECHPSARDRAPDNLADVAAPLQAVERRPRAQEDPSTGRLRSPVFQIRRDRLPDVMRQGQRPFLAAFAMHAQASFGPVDIPEFKAGDFPCAQPEPREQQQDSSIAQSSRRAPCFAFVQKPANTISRHRSWNRRHRPSSDARDGRCKIRLDVVAIPCKTEERTQRCDCVLCRCEGAIPRRVTPNIIRNLAGAYRAEFQFLRAAHISQKSSYISGVILHRRWREATVFVQIRPVFVQYPINLGRLGRSDKLAFDDAVFPKPACYAGQRDRVAPLGATALAIMAQERFFMFGCDFASCDLLSTQPPTELTDEKGLLPIRNLRIPPIGEIFGIWLEIRSQRPLGLEPGGPFSTGSVHRKNRVGRFWLNQTMPTDIPQSTIERKQMHRKLSIVPKAAYDLVLAPYQQEATR